MCSAIQRLVAGHRRGDPQREALLAQQGVAAVARAVGPDLARLGVVDDVLVLGVARPRHVLLALGERHADRVHAGDEVAVGAEHVEGALAHPGHDPHRGRDVGGVGELDADVGDPRAQRAHRERDDVHRAALHRATRRARRSVLAHLRRVAPVVGRPGLVLALGADEGPVLDPGDVAGVRPRQIGVRALRVGELLERSRLDQLLAEPVVLLSRPVAPVDRVRLGELGDLLDPGDQLRVVGQLLRRGRGIGQVELQLLVMRVDRRRSSPLSGRGGDYCCPSILSSAADGATGCFAGESIV